MGTLDVTLYLVLIISMVTSLQAISSIDLVKADKSERVMYLLDRDNVVKQYTISLGANPKGHKMSLVDVGTETQIDW